MMQMRAADIPSRRRPKAYLEKQGIELRISDTQKAVRAFNALQQDAARVVAALHLTC